MTTPGVGLSPDLAERLSPVLGPISAVRQIDTKAKSTVLVLRCGSGDVIAKHADPVLLDRERVVYETVLPSLGISAPSYRGWVEDVDGPWLLTDLVEGTAPDLARPADRDAVSRWAAFLHVGARSAPTPLPAPGPRPGPSERLDELETLFAAESAAGADRAWEIEACGILRTGLPDILAAAEALEPTLAHRDLAEQNLVLTPRGVVALDWDKAGFSCPAIDLWLADTDVYCEEVRRLGSDVDSDLVANAARAGKILAALAHDLASKRPKRRRRFLERMLTHARDLSLPEQLEGRSR